MMRLMSSMLVVAAVCFAMAAPAHAGGGGGGSKNNVTVKAKNIGLTGFGLAAQSGAKTAFPTNTSAYKSLAPEGGTANYSVKKGTFTLFGALDPETQVLGPTQLQTSTGNTTYVHVDADEGLATVVSKANF